MFSHLSCKTNHQTKEKIQNSQTKNGQTHKQKVFNAHIKQTKNYFVPTSCLITFQIFFNTQQIQWEKLVNQTEN